MLQNIHTGLSLSRQHGAESTWEWWVCARELSARTSTFECLIDLMINVQNLFRNTCNISQASRVTASAPARREQFKSTPHRPATKSSTVVHAKLAVSYSRSKRRGKRRRHSDSASVARWNSARAAKCMFLTKINASSWWRADPARMASCSRSTITSFQSANARKRAN